MYRVVRGLVALIDAQQGGGAGGPGLLNPGTIQSAYKEIFADETIPAGAYSCYIKNSGLEYIQVNGDDVPPGGHVPMQVQFNKTNNVQDFLPEVNISIPIDGEAWYYVQRPS
ncbi:MAG: hypothetical protein AAF789_12315 [Bacteroidota bacterium]